MKTLMVNPNPNKQKIEIKTLQESANHQQKTNDAYENQTTQLNASLEQTQYENPAYTYEHTT